MRALTTVDTVGGIWTYALDLARALAPHGVETALATMGAPLSHEQWDEARAIAGLRVFESTFKLEWMQDPWEDVAAAGSWLLDLERSLSPDIIHLNNFAHGGLPWHAPVVMVGHSCMASWWEAVKGEPLPPAWEDYRRSVAEGLSAADVVLAPTAAMLAALERLYGPFREAGVIHHARAVEGFAPAGKEDFVLTVGRLWDEARNIATLTAVAPDLPWPVLVAGEAQHPEGGTSGTDGVRMLGRLPSAALHRKMARAGIFALPARYEPFGLSALEAGLCGCALVLGDIESLREVWGDAARFVPPDDHDALRRALQSLISRPAERAEMAARARARALTYTPERMSEAYLEVYGMLSARASKEESRAFAT
jgi:glycosyltransferase involved in cell wall biosynthesis